MSILAKTISTIHKLNSILNLRATPIINTGRKLNTGLNFRQLHAASLIRRMYRKYMRPYHLEPSVARQIRVAARRQSFYLSYCQRIATAIEAMRAKPEAMKKPDVVIRQLVRLCNERGLQANLAANPDGEGGYKLAIHFPKVTKLRKLKNGKGIKTFEGAQPKRLTKGLKPLLRKTFRQATRPVVNEAPNSAKDKALALMVEWSKRPSKQAGDTLTRALIAHYSWKAFASYCRAATLNTDAARDKAALDGSAMLAFEARNVPQPRYQNEVMARWAVYVSGAYHLNPRKPGRYNGNDPRRKGLMAITSCPSTATFGRNGAGRKSLGQLRGRKPFALSWVRAKLTRCIEAASALGNDAKRDVLLYCGIVLDPDAYSEYGMVAAIRRLTRKGYNQVSLLERAAGSALFHNLSFKDATGYGEVKGVTTRRVTVRVSTEVETTTEVKPRLPLLPAPNPWTEAKLQRWIAATWPAPVLSDDEKAKAWKPYRYNPLQLMGLEAGTNELYRF